MENRLLYILAGYDDKTEEILSGIQKKLYDLGYSGVQTKDIPMHFTIGSFDTSMEDELKARLERIAETNKAFDVMFNHIGLFRLPENDVLFAFAVFSISAIVSLGILIVFGLVPVFMVYNLQLI